MYTGFTPASTAFAYQTFNGTGGQTDFTLSAQAYSAQGILVTISGIVQIPVLNYNTAGTTLSFTVAPPNGTNNIHILHLGSPIPIPIGGELTQTFTFTAGRNNANVTNAYLRSDGLPTNTLPLVLPFDCTLYAISASTGSNETWSAEVHGYISGLDWLSISGTSSGYKTTSASFDAGEGVALYCNGTGIDRPRITAFFRRRV